MWWLSRDWTARGRGEGEGEGVDKDSWRYLRGTKRRIAARLIRHKEWTAGWTARTLGKSAAKSPAVAHLHECSPPQTSSRGRWPRRHHVARERCLFFASKHLTCLIWNNHPAVNLPRAIRLSLSSPPAPPGSYSFALCHSFIQNLVGIYWPTGIRVYLRVVRSRSWERISDDVIKIDCYLN